MASVYKPTFTKPLPEGAVIVTEKGERFSRFKWKGKTVKAPLTKDGQKVRLESDTWHVRYKDLDGSWRSMKAYTDRRASESMALKLQERLDQRQEGVNPFSVFCLSSNRSFPVLELA